MFRESKVQNRPLWIRRCTRTEEGVDRVSSFVITPVSPYCEADRAMKIRLNGKHFDYFGYMSLIAQTFTAEIGGALSLGGSDEFDSDTRSSWSGVGK